MYGIGLSELIYTSYLDAKMAGKLRLVPYGSTYWQICYTALAIRLALNTLQAKTQP